MKTDSPKAWWLAARPKTLTGAAAPVLLALALAWKDAPTYRDMTGGAVHLEWMERNGSVRGVPVHRAG